MQHRWPGLLAEAIVKTGSAGCVGLDPVASRLPGELRSAHDEPVDAIEAFGIGVARAVAGVAPALKIQSACYERHGWPGVRALERTVAAAHEAGLLVILDAKRGDIGISAEHYAAAAKQANVDAITVSAYLGTETLEPFIDAGLGVYALVRTSNPGSDELQSMDCGGLTVAERVAERLAVLGERYVSGGLSPVGAVVGATKPESMAALRSAMPNAPVLVPGIGAQGGEIETTRSLRRAGAARLADAGVLLTASRSVIYAAAASGESWSDAVRRAAVELGASSSAALG